MSLWLSPDASRLQHDPSGSAGNTRDP